MSTIQHPVHSHTWWYGAAAAVVLAGLLAVLMATVFTGSGTSGTTGNDHPIVIPRVTHGQVYGAPCFAGRPNMSSDLIRSGCLS